MTAREIAEWRAYYELEPWGQWRDNYHAAQVCQSLAMIFRDPKKPPADPAGFFYRDAATAENEKDGKVLAFFRSHADRTEADDG